MDLRERQGRGHRRSWVAKLVHSGRCRMSFPCYPKYEDSGVEWLGQVPEHWALHQGRRLFSPESEPGRPADDQLSTTQKYGVVPQKLFIGMEDQKVAWALSGLDNIKHVEAGDCVISLTASKSESNAAPTPDVSACVNNVLTGKLLESEKLRQQAVNNAKDQFANSPDLSTALMNTIIEA